MKTQLAESNDYQTPSEILIPKLKKVRRRDTGSWMACCPAHDDQSPSLSIREATDGKILLHCMAGCRVDEIVQAIELEVSDLFPYCPNNHYGKRHKDHFPPFPWRDAIKLLHHHLLVVQLGAARLAIGESLSEADCTALARAALDIAVLIEEVDGAPSAEDSCNQVRAILREANHVQ